MNNYAEVLREHNLKATPQRLAMLNIIYLNGHISIDKLYEEIRKDFASMSLATIYKNINNMIKSTLLYEVKLPSNKSVFEIVKENHSHLLCKDCGDVLDVNIDTQNIEYNISKEYGFNVEQSDVVLSGRCKNCTK